MPSPLRRNSFTDVTTASSHSTATAVKYTSPGQQLEADPPPTAPATMAEGKFDRHVAKQDWNDFAGSESSQSVESPFRNGEGAPRRAQPPNQHPNMLGRLDSEIVIKVFNLPTSWTTKRCFDVFSEYGNITNIFIFQNGNGDSRGEAKLTFRPPPPSGKRFWTNKNFQAKGAGDSQAKQVLRFQVVNDDFQRPRGGPRTQVRVKRVSIGVLQHDRVLEMFETHEFPGKGSAQSAHRFSPLTLIANPEYHEFSIFFPVHFADKQVDSPLTRTDVLRVTFTLRQRLQILHCVHPTDPRYVILAFNTEIIPKCYRKGEESRFFKDHPYNWNEHNSFYRQTDVVLDPGSEAYKKQPSSLRRNESTINLGRWTAYSLMIDITANGGKEEAALTEMLNLFRSYNVDVRMNASLVQTRATSMPTVWEYINPPPNASANSLSALLSQAQPLTFDVQYQLEVCISGGWLNEHDLDNGWVEKLRSLHPRQACAILEHIATDRPEDKSRRIQEPFSIFNTYAPKQSVLAQKVPKGRVIIRSALITPTTIVFNTPSIEISNRVIRQYEKYADRFLRIRFADEWKMGRIYGRSDKSTDDELYTRIKRVLANGLDVGDRHYDLLAWGNSQFRENGAYFFCNNEEVSCDQIREWMGDFSDIKVVAKYAARIGQCFSTTRAVANYAPHLIEIPDVENDKFNFTDGVGKISPLLAGVAGGNFKTVGKAEEVASAYQFRLGGWKGVLAVWPDVKGLNIYLRPSQNKFKAFKSELEIIRHSQATGFATNRQIIMVLSALGIHDHVFLTKAKQQLARIHKAMTDPETAKEALRSTIDANHITPEIAEMVSAGFQSTKEPFLMSLLLLWRSWSIKSLKEKAKINIQHGTMVIGVTDEAEVLRGHVEKHQPKLKSKDHEVRLQAVPEVFLQVSNFEGTGQTKVIEGLMIMARNPSLYAGDIRVVKGVNNKKLRHLKDCVVLPQTGDRDLASMCSGGDLDGDDYLLCWDRELIPPEWNVKAPNFDGPTPVVKKDKVTLDDLTSFYVRYMKNTELGQIAHHHLAHADMSPDGVKSDKCIRLAELHSNAVDYPKTGVPAVIPVNLRVKKWPHFMEKKNSYRSTSALGKLFDAVERKKFEPPYENPFDKRVLMAYPTTPELEDTAADIKVKYDAALRRLMQQHGIKTEFEVWSTFALEYNGLVNDYKFAEALGLDVAAIKDQYVEICVEKAGGRQYEVLAPFVVAMYKVTNQQVCDALYECENVRLDHDGNVMPMREKTPAAIPFMSFPWLFSNVMCKIAKEYQALHSGGVVGGIKVLRLDDVEEISGRANGAFSTKSSAPEVKHKTLDGSIGNSGKLGDTIIALMQAQPNIAVSESSKPLPLIDLDSHVKPLASHSLQPVRNTKSIRNLLDDSFVQTSDNLDIQGFRTKQSPDRLVDPLGDSSVDNLEHERVNENQPPRSSSSATSSSIKDAENAGFSEADDESSEEEASMILDMGGPTALDKLNSAFG